MRRGFITLAIACVASFVATPLVSALSIPPAPSLDKPVLDQTKTLSDEQIDKLSQKINDGRKVKSYQLGVLMIPTLGDDAIEDYSIQVARAWGVGEKDKSNGVFLIIAKDDHKLRIEVGNGLEGDLTDAESGRIIRNTITPYFKENKFYEGIDAGITSIQDQVEGKASPTADSEQVGPVDIIGTIIGIGLFGGLALSWITAILARSKNWWAGGVVGGLLGIGISAMSTWAIWSFILGGGLIVGGLILDRAVSRNYKENLKKHSNPSWWAGGTWLGGGGSGGGFSGGGSFGGGGFSGGGSSGSW